MPRRRRPKLRPKCRNGVLCGNRVDRPRGTCDSCKALHALIAEIHHDDWADGQPPLVDEVRESRVAMYRERTRLVVLARRESTVGKGRGR